MILSVRNAAAGSRGRLKLVSMRDLAERNSKPLVKHPPERAVMMPSLCETCRSLRAVVTPKGSRFLLCQISVTDPNFPKYPPQPVVRCDGYQPSEAIPIEPDPTRHSGNNYGSFLADG